MTIILVILNNVAILYYLYYISYIILRILSYASYVISVLHTYDDLITPSPPTKSFDFRGFDSSKLLILEGGNSHVRLIL